MLPFFLCLLLPAPPGHLSRLICCSTGFSVVLGGAFAVFNQEYGSKSGDGVQLVIVFSKSPELVGSGLKIGTEIFLVGAEEG